MKMRLPGPGVDSKESPLKANQEQCWNRSPSHEEDCVMLCRLAEVL